MILVPRTRNKYGNQPVIVNGIRFDSKLEAERYQTLAVMERIGEIANLKVHPRWSLDVGSVHVCDYEADFSYELDGELVVEDAKGVVTAAYRIKNRLMRALHGIDIREVRG